CSTIGPSAHSRWQLDVLSYRSLPPVRKGFDGRGSTVGSTVACSTVRRSLLAFLRHRKTTRWVQFGGKPDDNCSLRDLRTLARSDGEYAPRRRLQSTSILPEIAKVHRQIGRLWSCEGLHW